MGKPVVLHYFFIIEPVLDMPVPGNDPCLVPCSDAFVSLVQKAAQVTGDAGLVAVSRFLEAPGEKQKAIAALERDYAGPESKNLPA